MGRPWNKSLFTCLILHVVGPLSSSGQIFSLKPRRMSPNNIIGCQWPIIQSLEKNWAGGKEKEKEEKVIVWIQLALPQVNASRIYESFSGQICLSGPLLGSSGCPWKMCVPEHREEVQGCGSKAGTSHPPAPQLQSLQLLMLKFARKNEKPAHKLHPSSLGRAYMGRRVKRGFLILYTDKDYLILLRKDLVYSFLES